MKKKINKLSLTPKKYKYPLMIFALFFVGLVITYIFVIIIGLNQASIQLNAAVWLSILSFGILICCLFALGIGLRLFYQMSQIRFNVDTLGTIKNIKSETWFLLNIEKVVKKDLHHSALISFSIYKIKKEAIAQMGYKTGTAILGTIIETIEEHFRDLPEVLYSYDYNESFLLYLKYQQESEVTTTLNALKARLNKKIESAGFPIGQEFSFGVYFNVDANIETAEMVRRSVMASDLANFNDKGETIVFESGMLVNDMIDNQQLYKDIVDGLERHEFEIFYQPEFNLKLNRFDDAEALIRWNHPQRGFLFPNSFIPFAEQSDLITQIDRYVFDTVCHDITNWKAAGDRLLPISVNLSRRSVYKSNTIEFITSTLAKYKMNPLLIKIEITESATSKDNLFVLSILKKLRALNIKVSIDDFGTGYSSLSSLKKLPFNVVKVDRSFFNEIEIDERSREVIRAIVSLVHSLDMTIVAEGIENKIQMQMIKDMGFDIIQGWYYVKALKKEDYLAYIKKNQWERKGNS